MNLQNKLEALGLGRLRVVRIWGEAEKRENGQWIKEKTFVEDIVPSRIKPSAYGTTYEMCRHGKNVFAAIMPRKTGRAMLKRYPELTLNREATDAFEILIPISALNWKLCMEMKLKYRRELSPEQLESLKKAREPYLWKPGHTVTTAPKQAKFERIGA